MKRDLETRLVLPSSAEFEQSIINTVCNPDPFLYDLPCWFNRTNAIINGHCSQSAGWTHKVSNFCPIHRVNHNSKPSYRIIDSHTGSTVRCYMSKRSANRVADRLDLEYGAVRYSVKTVLPL